MRYPFFLTFVFSIFLIHISSSVLGTLPGIEENLGCSSTTSSSSLDQRSEFDTDEDDAASKLMALRSRSYKKRRNDSSYANDVRESQHGTSQLEQLPEPLVHQVVSNLTFKDILSLEGTSKTLKEKILKNYKQIALARLHPINLWKISMNEGGNLSVERWRESTLQDARIRFLRKRTVLSPYKNEEALKLLSQKGSLFASYVLLSNVYSFFRMHLGGSEDNTVWYLNSLFSGKKIKDFSHSPQIAKLVDFSKSSQALDENMIYYQAKVLNMLNFLITNYSTMGIEDSFIKKTLADKTKLLAQKEHSKFLRLYVMLPEETKASYKESHWQILLTDAKAISDKKVRLFLALTSKEKNIPELQALTMEDSLKAKISLRNYYLHHSNEEKEVLRYLNTLSWQLSEKGHTDSQYYLGITHLTTEPSLAYTLLGLADYAGHPLASRELNR